MADGNISLSAESAILINAENGEVYFEKNADKMLPMASTTKIMTALVALEGSDLHDTVIIDRRAVGVEGSSVYLTDGELMTMEDLLYCLLLASANDAAEAIAIEIGGSIEGFAALMNKKANELGLKNTHFDNPHGLDSENHYTSAHDLALIAAYALHNPSFLKIVSTYKRNIQCEVGTRYLINHNKLLRSYDGCIGVKTGFTKRSGRCLVSAAERNGMRLVAVTLNAPDDWNDHKRMLDHGFSSYQKLTLLGEGEYCVSLPIVGGKEQTILLQSRGSIEAILPSGIGTDDCKTEISLPHFLYAPIESGEIVGKVSCYLDGKLLGESDIIALYSVPQKTVKKSFLKRLSDFFKNIF
ncbi:MAG: D-alanyl-D-alanine carboxypeptidase [Clostridia bacterium]|nr:D-alanyl-D-alanine carboxypeptidase [Clostridia bacterium]